MPKRIFYFDGQFIPIEEKLLDVFTPGKNCLHGVFETMLYLDGKIEYLHAHIERLLKGLRVLKIKHSYTEQALTQMLRKLVTRSAGIALGRLRIMIFQVSSSVHCVAMVVPYEPYRPKTYAQGLKLCIIETQRPASARYAHVKSLDYALYSEAYAEARAKGFQDAVLLNAEGHVFESTKANVFIKLNNQLITPPLSSGCLNGVIRTQLILLAKKLKIKLIEQNVTVAMLKKAQGIYMTNSLMGIMKTYSLLARGQITRYN